MQARIHHFPKPQRRRRPIAQPQLAHRALQVKLHRIGGDAEIAGERLIVGTVPGEKPQYRKFSWRQLSPLCCAVWFAAIAFSLGFWAAAGFYLARPVLG